ncbi:DUF881 domain-containing protein [Streptomyces sp. NPDC001922]|uniref:DUF881 domain-containing protein n=1 Tax=Streptomyces sp. NPDC001922 TaxID=3364624 RepID=UPI00368D7BE1
MPEAPETPGAAAGPHPPARDAKDGTAEGADAGASEPPRRPGPSERGDADRPQPKPRPTPQPRSGPGPQPAEGPAAGPQGGPGRSGPGPRPQDAWAAEPAAPEPGPERGSEPGPEPGREQGEEPLTGRRRLVAGLWPPRVTRAQLTVALLLFVLGLGLAIQVSSTSDNSALRGARQEDLVRILDELDDRTQRLEDEKRRLENQRTELENSSDQAEEARKQTVQKEQQLGILAGTVRAQGPGITVTVRDSKRAVQADMLLDAIQELRAAGAEAIQINGVRVVADTYVSDAVGGVRIDGKRIAQPYRFKVIGKPQDLEPALNIPGGVVQTLEKEQATVSVEASSKVTVDALRPAKRPDYARSSSQ